MAISEGVGIVSAGKEAKKRARMAGEKKVASSMSSGSYGGYVDAGESRGFVSPEQATRMLANPERFKMSPGEIRTLRQNMPVDRVQKDIQSEIRRPSFFSTTQDVKVASSDVSGLDVGDSFTKQASANVEDSATKQTSVGEAGRIADASEDANFKAYMKALGLKPRDVPPTARYMLRDNMRLDIKDGTFNPKDGTINNQFSVPKIDQAPKEEKKSLGQRVTDFTGSVLGAVTGTQAASASEAPAKSSVPAGSFGISKEGRDQAAINRGIKAAEATGIPSGTNLKEGSFGISEKGRQQAAANIAAKRAADAKRMSEAQAIAKRNPNVSIKDGRAVATNQSSTARAQASAVNRKIDGKTVSQVKAENERSMRQKAKERSEAFKAKKQEKAKGFSSPTSSKKSSPSPSKKSTPSKAKSKATAAKKSKSKSTGRAGKKGGGSTGSRGRGGTGGSKGGGGTGGRGGTGRGGKKGGGAAGSRGRGGASRGGRRGGVGRGGRRGGRGGRRCDIFLKYDISPLTNMNLVRDDLAEIAYFVKELQK